MKMRGKLLLAALVLTLMAMAVILSSCQKTTKKDLVDIAMIPTEQNVLNDRTFNQSTLEAIIKYSKENNLNYKTYEPLAKTEDQYLACIDEAVKDGAKIIFTPGFNFEQPILKAQDKYTDIKFVLIDGTPNNGKFDETRIEKVGDNTYSVLFSEEQAGFLAGYAVVKDGFKKLGFMGGKAFPAVVRFGYGFIQGAEYAAKELNMPDNSLEMKFGYSGDFLQTVENQAEAAKWYDSGTEIIFACGGQLGLSVMAAAEKGQDKWVVGVDADQHYDSTTVITSAMKMISNAVYQTLGLYYNNQFPGGKTASLGVNSDGVGIAIENARFRSFKNQNYKEIYSKLKENKDNITAGIIMKTDIEPEDLETKKIKIIKMQSE